MLHFSLFIAPSEKSNLYLLSFLGSLELSALQKGSTNSWGSRGREQCQKRVCRVGDLQQHLHFDLPVQMLEWDQTNQNHCTETLPWMPVSLLVCSLNLSIPAQQNITVSVSALGQCVLLIYVEEKGMVYPSDTKTVTCCPKSAKNPGLIKKLLAQSSSWYSYERFWCSHLKNWSVNKLQLQ